MVFHEQVLEIVDVMTGCALAEADEVRRTLGSPGRPGRGRASGSTRARSPAATPPTIVERVWEVLKAFASFGFCKAHAAAFALPTYQSAWLKAHHPAAFLAGVLTHDPGMYPKRLILDDARQLGIAVLRPRRQRLRRRPTGSSGSARATSRRPASSTSRPAATAPDAAPDLPDGRAYGIRLALADVKGITDAEVERIVAGRPYASLADFWHRARVARPVVERLVVAGAFDTPLRHRARRCRCAAAGR